MATNSANSVFCAFTVFGAVFTLFLHEMGIPKGRMGVLFSIFPFCSLLAPFLASWVARFGLRRAFLTFWGVRKFVIALLLLTPIVLAAYGVRGAFLYVGAILLVFAVCRAVGETAWFPWMQEAVPDGIRGKFSALNMMLTTAAGGAAVWFAGAMLEGGEGLGRFMAVMGAGVGFGLASVACAFFIPGGAASPPDRRAPRGRGMAEALGDRQFMLFLAGLGLAALGMQPLGSFLPLFLTQEVGMTQAAVVRLQLWALAGGLASAFLWGWAADRFGSKPVMLTGLYAIAALPVPWMLIPRGGPWAAHWAAALTFAGGVCFHGWTIGSGRHLFVTMVPPEKRTAYMAIYCAALGLAGGVGPLLAGQALEWSAGMGGQWLVFSVDAFTPLFLGSLVARAAAVAAIARTRSAGGMPTRRFARMFLQGNPLVAFESLVRYNFSADEESRAATTARLAEARSLLTVEEMLEALADPSFNVRFEAIVSAARALPDERLTDALLAALEGEEPDLAVAAAWALGRLGDARAIPGLRRALKSGFPLLESRCARALGVLGDRDSIPFLLERFRGEAEDGRRIAYAAALGALQAGAAAGDVLAYLRGLDSDSLRMETALSLARMTGCERPYIWRWRETRSDTATAASRAVRSLRRRLRRAPDRDAEAVALAEESAEAFAQGDMGEGARLLGRLARRAADKETEQPKRDVLAECATVLEQHGAERREYVLLALAAMS